MAKYLLGLHELKPLPRPLSETDSGADSFKEIPKHNPPRPDDHPSRGGDLSLASFPSREGYAQRGVGPDLPQLSALEPCQGRGPGG